MEESAPTYGEFYHPNTPHVRHVSRGQKFYNRYGPRELCLWFVELAILKLRYRDLPHYNKMFDVGVMIMLTIDVAISIELQRIGVGTQGR
ncbi:hypothetical protein SPFM10_00155 [Salmonella phage SPFM10]|nr:hypothetical protein SPFM10_00155 [Salmonella phage SPFM10]